MNASRADGGRTRVAYRLSALLLAGLTPLAAAAQSDGPIRLTPPASNPFSSPPATRDAEPAPARTPSVSTPEVERMPLAEPGRDEATVEVKRLAEPGTGGPLGVLQEGTGLGPEVWQGADPDEVARLLRELQTPLSQRALSELVQRLLLTSAAIGDGRRGEGEYEVAGLRALALVRLGNLDGAQRLAAAVTASSPQPTAIRAGIEALLVEQETDRACDAARGAVEASVDPYTQRVLVFCQILAGRKDEAGIGLDLIRETARADDPLFIALAENLLGFGPLPTDPPDRLSPLQFAMWQATKEPVPVEAWRASDPSIWRAVAASTEMPLADRIEAAELAVTSGALPGESLASLYRLLAGNPGERNLVATEEPPEWSVRERALLFQNAAAAVSQPERAAALQRLLELARARGGYEAVVLAAAPILGDLDPGARLTFFAPHAARAFLLMHDVTSAEGWAELARREREINPYAARDAVELQPLFALTGGSEDARLNADDFAAWWQQSLQSDAANARDNAVLIADLREALGEPVPSSAGMLTRGGAEFRGTGAASDSALVRAESVAEKARGKTILEVAQLLGGQSSDERNARRVAEAVRALRLVGLEGEARRLAIEAAIDAGI